MNVICIVIYYLIIKWHLYWIANTIKTTKTMNKAIIYDNTCPLCVWYTDKFVQMELMEADNRISFEELEGKNLTNQLDLQRSKHEIPLVDLENGETLYGLDSLVYILKQRWPFIAALLKVKALRWFFLKWYKLVSYNRRIIAAAPETAIKYDCTPDFNLKYRLLYIGGAIWLTTFISLMWLFLPGITNQFWGLVLITTIMVTCGTMLLAKSSERRITQLGHLATVGLAGILSTTPFLIAMAVGMNVILSLGLGAIAGGYAIFRTLRTRSF